ncbi:uncharacterized protein LOC112492764 [Ziziphus jujuba]|uniref:Uncharacterized protein LOC112492764 n=1 Tax=Ziziphus jujuba TaxID=326968 RepID=A0A6P6GF76_ZIZJJ|nr:uncharacterized protein LOC112492764 [Ziziphus jujuba]XP_048331659.1 uncharacterized protein LOC125422977 [Ziziphus jujuba var. spinosa]
MKNPYSLPSTYTMGNCIKVSFRPPQEKIKAVVFNGEVEEFKASTSVEKITSGPYIGFKLVHRAQPHSSLPPNSKVEPGHLVPYLTQPSKPLVSPKRANKESCKRQKVKIVLTRDQLELLLRGAKKLHPPGDIAVQMLKSFGFEEASPIWRPSLATIPEPQEEQ